MEEITLKTSVLTYGAKRWGSPDKPLILALHGWLDNAASFDRLAPLLSDYQILALDFAGHGFSDHRPIGASYHFSDYVHDALYVLESLEVDEVIVMGHSMGAAIGCLLAAAMPEKVKQLVLIDFIGVLTSKPGKMAQQLRSHLQDSLLQTTKKEKTYPDLEQMIRLRLTVNDMSESCATAIVSRNAKETNSGYTWRSDKRVRIRSPFYLTESQSDELLQAISVPSRLFLSEETNTVHGDFFARRQHLVKDMQTVLIPGKHHLHFDNAEDVASAVNEFLA